MIQSRKVNREKCFECGETSNQDHHVVPESVGGKKTVPLCEKCHEKIHAVGETLSRGNIHKSAITHRRPSKLTWDIAVRILLLRGEGKTIRAINSIIPEVSIDTIHSVIIGRGSLPNAIRTIQKKLCEQCVMRKPE
jgi:hypothetical protein